MRAIHGAILTLDHPEMSEAQRGAVGRLVRPAVAQWDEVVSPVVGVGR
jgi:hypothetical protein